MLTDLAKEETNIRFEIDGESICTLAELAKQIDLKKSTVRNRWNRGVHDIDKLTAKPKSRNFKARKLLYHGKHYSSLQDFADDNHLNSSTVRSRWSRGVRNPYDLAKPVHHKEAD